MAEREISILLKARDEASAVLSKFGLSLGGVIGAVSVAGAAVTAASKAITFLGETLRENIRSAIEAEDAENRLRSAVEKVGVNYANVSVELASYLAKIQATTRFTDEQASEALQRLIVITGSYEAGLKALPSALDLAARLHVDLDAAAKILGIAIEGNTALLARYGIRLDDATKAALKTADETERLTIIVDAFSDKIGGSAVEDAKSFAGQLEIVKNQLGELQEVLGHMQLALLGSAENLKDFNVVLFDTVRALKAIGEANEKYGGLAKALAFRLLPEEAQDLKAVVGYGLAIANIYGSLKEVIEKAFPDIKAPDLPAFKGPAPDATAALAAWTEEIKKLTAIAPPLATAIKENADKVETLRSAQAAGIPIVGGYAAAFKKLSDQLAVLKGEFPSDLLEGKAVSFDLTLGPGVAQMEAMREQFEKPLQFEIAGLADIDSYIEGMGRVIAETDIGTDAVMSFTESQIAAQDVIGLMTDAHLSFASALNAVEIAQQLAAESGITWTEQMDEIANKSLVVGAAMQVMQAAGMAAINAIVDGYAKGTLSAKSFAKAVAKGISDAIKAVASEALVKAIWELAQGLAAAAEYDATGAALHYAAAAKFAVTAAYATAAAAVAGRAGAAKGGIVAGSEAGDKQPFMLESGEGVMSRSLSSAVFGGRAALIDPRSLARLTEAASSARTATATAAPATGPVTLSRNATLNLTLQGAQAEDPEELLEAIVDLVQRRGYRNVASRLVGAR